jgi:hypothetical protein
LDEEPSSNTLFGDRRKILRTSIVASAMWFRSIWQEHAKVYDTAQQRERVQGTEDVFSSKWDIPQQSL